jgi:hypothetical protein
LINGELPLSGFSLDVENPVTIGSATEGTGGGKVSLKGLLVQLPAGDGTPGLFKALTVESHFQHGVLSAALGKGFLTLRLSIVFVSQFAESADVMVPQPVTDQVMLEVGAEQVVFTPGK